MTESKIPTMFELLYGAAAAAEFQSASPRLLAWSAAFDEWLDTLNANRRHKALNSWRRLLSATSLPPWELDVPALTGNMNSMLDHGYAIRTVSYALAMQSKFFRWCRAHNVDPEWAAGWQAGRDPAARVNRPCSRPYTRSDGSPTPLLSQAEVDALLGLVRQDPTALGKRDYAFFLARLHTGVPIKTLRLLRWSQIQDTGEAVHVRWRPEIEPIPLPAVVWSAIQDALQASGRWDPAGLPPDEFIFPPLRQVGLDRPNNRRADWATGRPVAASSLNQSLKRYGLAAGLPLEKLSLVCLHNTALRLFVDACTAQGLVDTSLPRAVQRFAASLHPYNKYRLKTLPPLPPSPLNCSDPLNCSEPSISQSAGLPCPQPGFQSQAALLPNRRPRPFPVGHGLKHGLYALRQPEAEVRAVLQENIQGIDEEVESLRALARGLIELLPRAPESAQVARLSEAYARAAGQLEHTFGLERQHLAALKRIEEQAQVDQEFTAVCWELNDTLGWGWSLAGPGQPAAPAHDLSLAARRLPEEIASLRYALRAVFDVAMLALDKRQVGEYIHLVEVYGLGCRKLMRLLLSEVVAAGGSPVSAAETFRLALKKVWEDWAG